jgi:hypothetical protein
MVQQHTSIELYEKFQTAMLRSFVDMNRTSKWCPNPTGCQIASQIISGCRPDIFCECGYAYCFVCIKEAHKPALCEHIDAWDKKNLDESENGKCVRNKTLVYHKRSIFLFVFSFFFFFFTTLIFFFFLFFVCVCFSSIVFLFFVQFHCANPLPQLHGSWPIQKHAQNAKSTLKKIKDVNT